VATGITVVIGAVVAVIGAWLYKNPAKFAPRWGILNPQNPRVQAVGRVYGLFFIFFGLLASGTAVWNLVPRVPVTIMGLATGGLGTWLLRKYLSRSPAPAVQVASVTVPDEKQPLLTRNWKKRLVVTAIVVAALAITIITALGSSDSTRIAFATAQSKAVIKGRLGEPVKRGFFTSGSIEFSGSTGHADLEIPLRGPKGKATVYAQETKTGGVWKINALQVSFDGEDQRIDLLDSDSGQP